jgi:hypothetical protein
MNLRKILLFLGALLIPIFTHAESLETLLQQELDGYIQLLNDAEGEALADAANQITSSGLSDQRLFDTVKHKLISKHQEQMADTSKNKVIVHQVVTMLRTLASSGDSQYYPTLDNIQQESKNRAIRNRAKHVKNKISFYHDRNRLMQDMQNHIAGQSLHSTRLLNLLNNSSLVMNRFAAEEIVRKGSAEPVIQDWIYDRLQKQIHQPKDKLHIDTLAWYCKVLGTVNKEKYTEFLTDITKDKTINAKIRKHAKKILKS